MFINRFINKKTILITCGAGITASYFYEKHKCEKKIYDRMNFLLQNKTELSGVYLQQRQPFGFLWFFQWLLPYHQSLKIVNKDGTIRYVGLGKTHNKGFFDLEVQFVLHEGLIYEKFSNNELSFPIECWSDYFDKFGHFPENINVDILNKITMTFDEADENDKIYKTTFGKPNFDLNGDFVFETCRSAVMYAIRQEELSRISQ